MELPKDHIQQLIKSGLGQLQIIAGEECKISHASGRKRKDDLGNVWWEIQIHANPISERDSVSTPFT